MSRKRKSQSAKPVCALCSVEMFASTVRVVVAFRTVCFACAWKTVEGLREFYQAPEITALERARFIREKGFEGKKPAAKVNVNEPGWVYYIRMGDTIKIGYSIDVAQRMRSYPPNAELLAAHPGTEVLEKQIHQKFREHLVRGREWFAPAAEIMTHIASVVERFGDQSHQAYEYTRPKTQEEKVAAMFARPYSTADIAQGVHYAG